MVTLENIFPKLLLQVSVRELQNSMVSPPYKGKQKEARYKQYCIISSDYAKSNILQSQLKNMPECYKVMCGCDCCIYVIIIHFSLLTWCDCHLKTLGSKRSNAQN